MVSVGVLLTYKYFAHSIADAFVANPLFKYYSTVIFYLLTILIYLVFLNKKKYLIEIKYFSNLKN